MTTPAINPFLHTVPPPGAAPVSRPVPMPKADYARLPLAPVNASPVPRLTSLYHHAEAGPYGDRRYPGNCSGEIIKDVLRYFAPERVLDPLCGAPHNGSCVANAVMWPRISPRDCFRLIC